MNPLDMLKAFQVINTIKNVEPVNDISKFVSETFASLFGQDMQEMGMIRNLLVHGANADPEVVEKKIREFHTLWVVYVAERGLEGFEDAVECE